MRIVFLLAELLIFTSIISSVLCINSESIKKRCCLKNIKSILAAVVVFTHCNPSNAAGNAGNVTLKINFALDLFAELTFLQFIHLLKIIQDGKQFNLPPSEVEKIVADDINSRQALITADFTRSIYSESCRFQDEIDVYPIDDYVRGTKLLFNPALSHVDLIGPVTTVSDNGYVLYVHK